MYLLISVCDEATFTGCTSRSLLPRSSPIPLCLPLLSVCSSSRQPDSHRSPAQMPWPSPHVCERVCTNKCVLRTSCSALSRTASQFVTTLPHISVVFCFLTIPLSPASLASFFPPVLFGIFDILMKSMKCVFSHRRMRI